MGYVGAVAAATLFLLIPDPLISTQAKDQFGALLCWGCEVMFCLPDFGEYRDDHQYHAGNRDPSSFYELRE